MEEFIAQVEAYAAACGVKPTTVVQRAASVGGGAWDRWTSGGSPTLATVDRVRAYMTANPPPSVQQSDPPAAKDAAA